jgi:hypothetical protein
MKAAKIRIKVRKRRVQKLLEYLKANLGAPFIVAFMILLASAAAYLAVGMEPSANDVAVYAYYCLVIGVILQLASYVREGKNVEEP